MVQGGPPTIVINGVITTIHSHKNRFSRVVTRASYNPYIASRGCLLEVWGISGQPKISLGKLGRWWVNLHSPELPMRVMIFLRPDRWGMKRNVCWLVWFVISLHSLKTKIAPENRPKRPKRKRNSLPIIHFQVVLGRVVFQNPSNTSWRLVFGPPYWAEDQEVFVGPNTDHHKGNLQD